MPRSDGCCRICCCWWWWPLNIGPPAAADAIPKLAAVGDPCKLLTPVPMLVPATTALLPVPVPLLLLVLLAAGGSGGKGKGRFRFRGGNAMSAGPGDIVVVSGAVGGKVGKTEALETLLPPKPWGGRESGCDVITESGAADEGDGPEESARSGADDAAISPPPPTSFRLERREPDAGTCKAASEKSEAAALAPALAFALA